MAPQLTPNPKPRSLLGFLLTTTVLTTVVFVAAGFYGYLVYLSEDHPLLALGLYAATFMVIAMLRLM